MAETPTFGRYAEIPYDRMTPEQQEGYRSVSAFCLSLA
jgi:4-carboxymuconolactone decarboxylase